MFVIWMLLAIGAPVYFGFEAQNWTLIWRIIGGVMLIPYEVAVTAFIEWIFIKLRGE